MRPAASARPCAARSDVVEVHRPVGEEPLAAGDDGVAVDDAGDAETLRCWRSPRRRAASMTASACAPSAIARAIGCSEASSSDAGEPQQLVAVDARGRHDVDERHRARS